MDLEDVVEEKLSYIRQLHCNALRGPDLELPEDWEFEKYGTDISNQT